MLKVLQKSKKIGVNEYATKRDIADLKIDISELRKDMKNDRGELIADFKRHNEALAEQFRHDIKAMTEQFPTRTEVRSIVREEMKEKLDPIRSDISVIKLEVRSINKRLNSPERRIVSPKRFERIAAKVA